MSAPRQQTRQDRSVADARRAVDEAEAPPERAVARLALARTLRGVGRPVEAAEEAGRATSALRAAERPLSAARAQRLAADCLADADRHEDALGLLKRARRVFVELEPDGPDVAGTEAAASRCLRALGRASASHAAAHRAEVGFERAGMAVRAAVCRLDRAVLLHDQGDIATALELLTEARTTFVSHRRPDLTAVCDFDLGVAYLDHGQPEDAIERFVGARGIFRSLGRRADHAACDLNMGVALAAVDRTEEARNALRRARTAFRDLGRDRDAEQAEHDLDVLDGLVDPDTAELSVLRDLGEVPDAVSALAATLPEPAPAEHEPKRFTSAEEGPPEPHDTDGDSDEFRGHEDL